ILVQRKFSNAEHIEGYSSASADRVCTNIRMAADLLQIKLLTYSDKGRFSFGSVGKNIAGHKLVESADILNFHWINEGFLSVKDINTLIRQKRKIVWTLHDMWTFTGGCHYSGECRNYEKECGYCPYLRLAGKGDASNRLLTKRKSLWEAESIHVVTPSKWLGEAARSSSLLGSSNITVIPNPLNIDLYYPDDKKKAREFFHLPQNKILLLFGSMALSEKRKGFEYLVHSIQLLLSKHPELKDKLELLIFGSYNKDGENLFPIKANYLGRLSTDEQIRNSYNAADLFVAPSLEDNLPNTVMEALGCGIPAAAFNIGGMPDMIGHKQNGYLAAAKSAEDLASGIYWCLEDPARYSTLSAAAREKVLNNFTPEMIGAKYRSLYKDILSI
ncbi:MAG TPA: glycosyltransferase, partial [Ignavibacteriales bacterium]|nr:glycosyltransferase [Ignavibacteriales bacterium]